MQVVVSVREGTAPLTQACLDTFHTITSFAELFQDDPDSPTPSPKKARVESEGEGKEMKGAEADTQNNGKEKDDKRADSTKDDEGSKGTAQNKSET